MRYRKYIILIGLLVCWFSSNAQKLIGNEQLHYRLTIPDAMTKAGDTATSDTGDMYYDNDSGVIMLITSRNGIYPDTKSYLDCANTDLEKKLRRYQDDTSLTLVSCNRPQYYPDSAVVLHFETHILPAGLNRCIIYFIHHDHNEIQFSFLYDKAFEKNSMQYIDRIMKTLILD